MSDQSDITLNSARFTPTVASKDITELVQKCRATPGWPTVPNLPAGLDAEVPSRDAGRTIPVRIFHPEGESGSKGVYLHMHGGGWMMFSHRDWDEMIQAYANGTGMTVVSVGYRLAPDHPYPAAVHDCIDAALYLLSAEGRQQFAGAELRTIGGESAGGHLAAVTSLHLVKTKPEAAARLAGLILVYGAFDLSMSLPSVVTSIPGSGSLLLDRTNMEFATDAFLLPDIRMVAQRRAPEVSPLYEDLVGLAARSPGGKLPPALFICGTADPLIDDTVLMSVRWMATGSDAVTKFYPGMPHLFDMLPDVPEADDARQAIYRFLRERI